MLSHIPPIFKQECVYGIKSRIIRDNLGNKNSYLGEFMRQVTSVDLPTNLRQLYIETKHLIPWTLEGIVSDHTIYRAYWPFLTSEKRSALFAWMAESSRNVYVSLGINTSSFERSGFPKFCPICGKEDLNKHNEAYFHTIHQVPNIQVCPEHNCRLIEYKPTRFEVGTLKYVCLDKDTIISSPVKLNTCSALHNISIEFKKLLDGLSAERLTAKDYRSKVEERGYFDNNYLLRSELIDKFQNYYKDIKDEYLKSRVKDSYHWLGDIVLRPSKVFNPFQYLLFDNFVQNLNKRIDPTKQHPFGSGPWPCYNKVSGHFMQKVITDITIEYNKNQKLVALFKCSCGMAYSIQHIKSKNETKEKIRVRERGKLWMDKLNDCVKSKVTLNEMSKLLGTNITTVKRLTLKKPKTPYLTKKLIASKREQWLSYLNSFESAQYSQCRVKYPALYKWLIRYDKEWLLTTKNQKQVRQLNLKLDWNEIDKNMEAEIIGLTEKLKKSNPSFRVSKTVIGKMITRGTLILSTSLKHLPKTQKILKSNTESMASYQSRKIENAISTLVQSRRSLTKSSIIKEAKIKTP